MKASVNKTKDTLTIEVPFSEEGWTSNGAAKSKMHVSFHSTINVDNFGALKIGFNGMAPKSRKKKAA
jgi:hypothetical protein